MTDELSMVFGNENESGRDVKMIRTEEERRTRVRRVLTLVLVKLHKISKLP